MLNLKHLFAALFFAPLVSFAQPMQVDVPLSPETFPNENVTPSDAGTVEEAVQDANAVASTSTETPAEQTSVDETDIPYEDFSQHAQEQPASEAPVESQTMSLETAATTTPVTAHPLLSLETTGSIFDQFAEFEKNKLLMSLQTEEQKMELERDRIKLQRLKLAKELAEYGDYSVDGSSSDDSSEPTPEEASHYVPSESTSSEPTEEVVKSFADTYTIKTIMGVGKKLIAVLINNDNDTKTRVKVGTELDGYTIRKIQPKKGITIEKDGETQEIEIQ